MNIIFKDTPFQIDCWDHLAMSVVVFGLKTNGRVEGCDVVSDGIIMLNLFMDLISIA